MNETLKIISQRRSCRTYQDKPLKDEELQTILDAGIQAPSSMNRQLCEAFAIVNTDLIQELSDAVQSVIKERGDKISEHYHFAYHAPVLVIVSGPEYDSRRVEDGSCMLENMFLGATSLGIGSCWINQLRDTQNVEEVRLILKKIGLPANHQVVGCAVLGYPQQETPAKEKKQERIHIVQ